MPDVSGLASADGLFARFVIERGLGAIYFIAFVVAWQQFPALCGERGLDPAPEVLAATTPRRTPSLFHWRYSDRLLRVVALVGALLSLSIVLGLAQQMPLPVTMLGWATLWALYLSIVNVGGVFYAFGWETLLLEAGFLAIFLGNASVPAPWPILLAFRWLAFRVEFGAGLIKLRGDPCWRQLTCMEWHHETQPLPNPLSWFFHHLPRPLHRVEVVGNFVAQLVLPFGLFLPQPIASAAAVLMILTQLYLVVSGNYAWLNWITIVVLFAAVSDALVPEAILAAVVAPAGAELPLWFAGAVIAVTLLVTVLSYYPVRNMASRYQAMNASFDPFHLVNTYGAFGTVGRRRYEVIVEGTTDEAPGPDTVWQPYEFKAKPGDPRRMPPQVAPYHYRLDWAIWFLPLSPLYGERWFVPFLARLLEGDRPILRLLRRDPFGRSRPTWIRARLRRYEFSSWSELRRSGAWWRVSHDSPFVEPFRLRPSTRAA